MVYFRKINTLQIGDHLWTFTEPQIIEYERDGDSVIMKATLRVHHEEDLMPHAPDLGQAVVNEDEDDAVPGG